MVQTITVRKCYPDSDTRFSTGKLFNQSFMKEIITKDTDCYFIDENDKKKILFKFRKNVIKLPKEKLNEVRTIYENYSSKGWKEDSFNKNNNRRKYKMNLEYRNPRSKISGYYDRPHPKLFKHFDTQIVCRQTAFTKQNFKQWEQVIPFFEQIGKLYKKLAPKEYKLQMNEFKKFPKGMNMQVGNTPFTTITSNYNWRTACHKDSGDFENGMGNLTILGDDTYRGGYLAFPQFKIAIDVRPLDFVIMDVHQWHCNTELKADSENVRLSFVCYFRRNMVKCNKKKRVNGELLYYKSHSSKYK